MYSYGPPHMAEQKQDDQLEHTYSSYVRIRDVALKTWWRWLTIGRSDERGSGISVLAARHDDDDDDDDELKRILHDANLIFLSFDENVRNWKWMKWGEGWHFKYEQYDLTFSLCSHQREIIYSIFNFVFPSFAKMAQFFFFFFFFHSCHHLFCYSYIFHFVSW